MYHSVTTNGDCRNSNNGSVFSGEMIAVMQVGTGNGWAKARAAKVARAIGKAGICRMSTKPTHAESNISIEAKGHGPMFHSKVVKL